jgi:hypothetical protein
MDSQARGCHTRGCGEIGTEEKTFAGPLDVYPYLMLELTYHVLYVRGAYVCDQGCAFYPSCGISPLIRRHEELASQCETSPLSLGTRPRCVFPLSSNTVPSLLQ